MGRRLAGWIAGIVWAGVVIATAPAAGRVVISTPAYPIFVVSGYGSLWVGAHHANVVYRIDPDRNTIVRRITLPGTPCGPAAVGFGGIFVPDCLADGGNTLEISAKTNKLIRRFPGGPPVLGAGSLWTLDPDGTHVTRFDPHTGVVLKRISTGLNDGAGGGAESIGAYGAGSIWVGDQVQKTVVRIAASTNSVSAVIPLPGAATQASSSQGYAGGGPMAVSAGKIWYGNPAGVFMIDPATNTATRLRIVIGSLDAWGDIVFAATRRSIWVRTSGTRVTRLDATGTVRNTYPATGGGGGIAVARGSLWIANAGADTVWREPLHQQ